MKHKHTLNLVVLATTLLATACGSGGSGGSGGGGGSNGTDGGNGLSKIEALGKALFFDTDLSSSSNQSCGSCHDPVAGFADPMVTVAAPVSEGSEALAFGNRNAPTAAYASLIPAFIPVTTQTLDNTVSNFQGGQFLDGRRSTLAEQAKDPFLNPVEMNNANAATVVNKVQIASYANDFTEVFGANAFNDSVQAYDNIALAIAAFETSAELNSFTSKFDAVVAGNATFSTSEQRGFDLFTGAIVPDAKCANCHTVNSPSDGSLFTDFNYYNVGTPINPNNPAFVANNAFRDGGLGDSPVITLLAEQIAERGKFRVPTLRNVEFSAPYMHNGVYATLADVIRHYDIQVANLFITPEVNSNIANELDPGGFTGLGLQPQDYTDLENFMLTLSDGYF